MAYQPKVSIIIPVYNGSNYLKDAIESALNQTYENIEILVINDGSNDSGKTEQIALSYGENIIYLSKKNGGVSTALNLGIEKMTGEYFSWLSHDDLYLPNKIELQIEEINKQINCRDLIIYSDYTINTVDKSSFDAIKLKNTNPESFKYRIATGNDIHGCTMLIPKYAFQKHGLFDEKLRALQDYEMWYRLADKFKFIHIPEQLVIGRVHSAQVGVRMRGLAKQENINLRKEWISKLNSIEIKSSNDKSPALTLAKLFETYIYRDLYPVAKYCLFLSFKEIKKSKFKYYNDWLVQISKSMVKILPIITKRKLLAIILNK